MNEFFNALKNKRARKEYLKSMLVGILSTALDFLVQAVIMYMAGHDKYLNFFSVFSGKTVDGLPYTLPLSLYLTSIVVSFTVSILFNYLMCAFFVYEYGNVGRNNKGFLRFCIFSLLGLSITTAGSAIGYAGIGANSGIAVWGIKICISLVMFVFNFFTRKYFVFNIALIRDDDNTINL